MKKRMIGVVILGAVLLTGCSKDEINFTKSDTWDTKWHVQEERRPGNIVPYQNGFYYIGEPSCLSYYDIESEQSVVLCGKNGCSHDNKNCFAYIEEMPEIHDDKLYFVSHEGVVSVANADNTEKEKKFTLLEKQKADGNIAFVSGFLMSEDSLFLGHRLQDTRKMTEKKIYMRFMCWI